MAPSFAHTRNMAWHSNRALAQRRATTTPLVLSAQITPANLTRIFSLMPNLVSVELHVDTYPTLSDFDNLRKLKKLELNMLSFSTAGFSVAKFAELFSRISSLRLVMPVETNEISMVSLPVTSPWVMSVLEVEPEAIPLAARCEELKELIINCDRDFEQVSMRPIMACQKLEVLRSNVGFASLSDHTEVLISIVSLRHLEVVVDSPGEIEFLRADESAVNLPLASLDTIIIKHTHRRAHANNSSFCRTNGSVLSFRPNLRRFCVEGADVNPLMVFPEPGQEGSSAEWVCSNLECLSLTLSWPTSSINTAEKMRRCWDTVFNQIDKLLHLKSLSIESEDLDVYPGLGFLENCHHLSQLKSLVLAASGPCHAWRAQQIELLLERCPCLKTIELGSLKRTSGEVIKAWLDKNCYGRIELTFDEEDSDDEENDECDDDEEDCEENEGHKE
ncbi:hypothetical protein BGX26_012721 [Mortierella sp. AD094]|nr:hypothetical protein BGX26_012721 [Mortierella sp. AD094]